MNKTTEDFKIFGQAALKSYFSGICLMVLLKVAVISNEVDDYFQMDAPSKDVLTSAALRASRIQNRLPSNLNFSYTYLRRKLRSYGHIARSTGLAKTILQGMVQGGRRKGRHKKEMGRVRVSE